MAGLVDTALDPRHGLRLVAPPAESTCHIFQSLAPLYMFIYVEAMQPQIVEHNPLGNKFTNK